MSDDLRTQIYGSLSQKRTDELIEIWQTNNHVEWDAKTFDVIREILQERHIELPPQNELINASTKIEENEATTMTLAQLYFSFNGRIGLGTYWLKGILPIFALIIIFGIIEGATPTYSAYSGIPTILGSLLVLWPSLALTVKRWHDRDKSGFWIFIGFIPIIGIWAFVETCLLLGTDGPNEYGSKSF